jgi:hypothetical protein
MKDETKAKPVPPGVAELFLVRSMARRWVRVLMAIRIGVLVTAATAAASFLLSSRGADTISEVVFWPNTLLQALTPAPNIGTPDHPLYEGTPLNLLAFLTSFPLAVISYGFVAYVFLRRISAVCRRNGKTSN